MPDFSSDRNSIAGYELRADITDETGAKLAELFGPPMAGEIRITGVVATDHTDGMHVEIPGLTQPDGSPARGVLRAIDGKPGEYRIEPIDAAEAEFAAMIQREASDEGA